MSNEQSFTFPKSDKLHVAEIKRDDWCYTTFIQYSVNRRVNILVLRIYWLNAQKNSKLSILFLASFVLNESWKEFAHGESNYSAFGNSKATDEQEAGLVLHGETKFATMIRFEDGKIFSNIITADREEMF